MKPLISVLIPYLDSRRSPERVLSWTRDQTIAPEKFEVIVITGTTERDETALANCLRSHDRLIRSDRRGHFARLGVGAAAARGEFLFFTEDHVVADPDCLRAVEKFFGKKEHEQLAGTGMKWGHINRTAVARTEQQLNEADMAHVLSSPGNWNTLRARGFALKRSVYDELGGFEARFGAFSEALLSARLNASGYKVGLIEESGVRHINTDTLSEIYRNVSNYARNEAAYCSKNDQQFCQHYFKASKVLLQDTLLQRTYSVWLARALFMVLLREISKSPAALVKQSCGVLWLREALSLAISNTSKLFVERMLAFLLLLSAWLRFSFWRFDQARRLVAFRDFWNRTKILARLNFAAKSELRPQYFCATSFDASHSGLRNAVACNELERYDNTDFLWTKLASLFIFDVPAADYIATIDTGGVARGHCKGVASIFWNEHFLPEEEVVFDDEKLHFKVKESLFSNSSEQRLTIVCRPHKRSESETRPLGLPVSKITLTICGDALSDSSHSIVSSRQAMHGLMATESEAIAAGASKVPAIVEK